MEVPHDNGRQRRAWSLTKVVHQLVKAQVRQDVRVVKALFVELDHILGQVQRSQEHFGAKVAHCRRALVVPGFGVRSLPQAHNTPQRM